MKLEKKSLIQSGLLSLLIVSDILRKQTFSILIISSSLAVEALSTARG